MREGTTGESGLLRLLFLVVFCASCSLTGPGDTEELVAELGEKIPPVIAAGNAPSMQIAVVHRDQIVWSRAFGENTSVDHVYMNASVQKTFTAIAVLQLVDAGLVDLDADVGDYLPFPVRHPEFPETPITVRMLVAHRSGLDYLPHQFAWDTESTFAGYRPACPEELSDMTLEEYVTASLAPGGLNYDPGAWVREPGSAYHYSVGAYPLLRYLVGRVAGTSYATYLRESIFTPLGMTSSGFSADEFAERHAIPYTRINGENIELPLWDGRGSLMHTTAADMASFMLALMHDDRSDGVQLLQPETVELMRRTTTRFRLLFRGGGDDLQRTAQGLGHSSLRGGWFGIGGSVPGYQCLFRFRPDRQIGFVLLTNVNAILGGDHNHASARAEIHAVQDALVSVLDPAYVVRRRAGEIGIIGALILYFIAVRILVRWRKMRSRR